MKNFEKDYIKRIKKISRELYRFESVKIAENKKKYKRSRDKKINLVNEE